MSSRSALRRKACRWSGQRPWAVYSSPGKALLDVSAADRDPFLHQSKGSRSKSRRVASDGR